MNSFDTARGVEAEGNLVLLPYLKERADGALVLTNKGPLARWGREIEEFDAAVARESAAAAGSSATGPDAEDPALDARVHDERRAAPEEGGR